MKLGARRIQVSSSRNALRLGRRSPMTVRGARREQAAALKVEPSENHSVLARIAPDYPIFRINR
jgi:hypothetical protein